MPDPSFPFPEPAAGDPASLADVVDALARSGDSLTRKPSGRPCPLPLPSRDALASIAEDLRSCLFPGYFGNPEVRPDTLAFHLGSTLDRVSRELKEQVKRGICFSLCPGGGPCPPCDPSATAVVRAFLSRLPAVRALLASDVQAAFEGDPAARSPDEAIFCYPGILAVTNFRLAHELHVLGVPLIPRILTEHAHGLTGIDIHPGATIQGRFLIDHGTGVVIGETSVVGQNVRIYQGVTLGARSFPKDENGNPIKGIPRHPVVEDDVTIYSGATILGRVRIGRGSVIGGNVWIMEDVPPESTVTQGGC